MPMDGLWVSLAVYHRGKLNRGWRPQPDVSCSVQATRVRRLLSPPKWRLPSLLPSLWWQPPCPYLSYGDPIGAPMIHIHQCTSLYPIHPANFRYWLLLALLIFTLAFPKRCKVRMDTARMISKYFDRERKATESLCLEPVNIDMG